MDNSRTSLIQKVITKGTILTPLEAVHLKYLSQKSILLELVNIEKATNPYLATEEARGVLSPFMVDYLCSRASDASPDQYNNYSHAYRYLINEDGNSEKLGYKGLTLLTQLRLLKLEHENSLSKDNCVHLMKFKSFSLIHQEDSSYKEVIGTLGNTFRYFLKDIDNILTMNFYLNQMVELNELSCLSFLSMWLNPKNYEDSKEQNEAKYCCSDENIKYLLEENHANYVEIISRNITNLPIDFEERSLEYVKDVLFRITRSLDGNLT